MYQIIIEKKKIRKSWKKKSQGNSLSNQDTSKLMGVKATIQSLPRLLFLAFCLTKGETGVCVWFIFEVSINILPASL